MEGRYASRLMKALCAFAHNMARDDKGCGVLVAEVEQKDPLRDVIPHWRKLSPLSEDLLCVKTLNEEELSERSDPSDWTKCRPPSPMIFVDPRDI